MIEALIMDGTIMKLVLADSEEGRKLNSHRDAFKINGMLYICVKEIGAGNDGIIDWGKMEIKK